MSRVDISHVRSCVRACEGTLEMDGYMLGYNAKEKVRDVSAYLLLGNSRGIDPRARAVSHTYACVDYPIYVRIYHYQIYHAGTAHVCMYVCMYICMYTRGALIALKRPTLLPLYLFAATKQFATVPGTSHRFP